MATKRSSPFHLPTPLAFASSLELQTWHTTLVRTLSALIDVTGLNSTDADSRLGALELGTVPEKVLAAAGQLSGYTTGVKFGRLLAATGGAYDDIWPQGGTHTHMTSAQRLRIKAGGDAADTAAGTGAQEIVVGGLDANYNPISETLATAGASASDWTSNTFLRVERAYVTKVGSGEQNAANIDIEEEGGSTVQARIDAAEGQTQQCWFTVPDGKYAYVVATELSILDQEGAGTIQHLCHFRGRIRLYDETSNNNYQSWRTVFDVGLDTDGTNAIDFNQETVVELPPKTDVRVQVFSHTAGAQCDARLFYWLVDQSIVEGT